MKTYYERVDYFEGAESGYDSYSEQEIPLRKTFAELLRQMSRRGLCGGSVLEIGCGYGYFLREAEEFYTTRYGTDYSDGALEHAEPHADKLFRGGFDAIPPHLQFDCVIALHVVEHVYDPVTFVQEAYRRLKPGGTLLLAAPDMGSWWRKVLGARWPSFKYPEHVAFYDRKTLKDLLSSVPLVDHAPIPYPHAFPMNLVLRKLRMGSLPFIGSKSLWIPSTTVAMAARKPVAEETTAAA